MTLWSPAYDSLTEEVQEAIPLQERVGKLIDLQFQLPQRANSAFQPVGSNACGFYVLSFIVMEIRLFGGDWLSEHPDQMHLSWKQRPPNGGTLDGLGRGPCFGYFGAPRAALGIEGSRRGCKIP